MMTYDNPLHQRDIPSTGYSSLSNAFQHPGQRQVALLAGVDSRPRILRPVAFTANGRPGIRVQDICSGHGYHYLDGPNDFVMAKTNADRIKLYIVWPGYECLHFNRMIDMCRGGRPITRAELASELADTLSRFMETARITTPTSYDFAVGSRGITLNRTIILGMHHVCENIWQADVAHTA